MKPCYTVMASLPVFLATQNQSVKTLILTRCAYKKGPDSHRRFENFSAGTICFRDFCSLEYLEIDSRFFLPDLPEDGVSLEDNSLQWLGLPSSIKELSLGDIQVQDLEYFRTYITRLEEAIGRSWLPNLKLVRCRCPGLRKFDKGLEILRNLLGHLVLDGPRLEKWQYDVGTDKIVDTVTSRVRKRRRSKRD